MVGDAAVLRKRAGDIGVFGRITARNGGAYEFTTPGGTVIDTGAIWVRPLEEAEAGTLRFWEEKTMGRGVQLYAGKLTAPSTGGECAPHRAGQNDIGEDVPCEPAT